MSIAIDTGSFENAEEKCVFHLMPCEIDQDGEANVSSFFTSGIRKVDDADGIFTASFRGRPLDGQTVEVPKGFTGILLKEHRKQFNEEDERQVKATHCFKEFTHWNLDAPPSGNDKINKMLQWIDIAKSVHSPVKEVESPQSTPEK